jgi:hypothetical protein
LASFGDTSRESPGASTGKRSFTANLSTFQVLSSFDCSTEQT